MNDRDVVVNLKIKPVGDSSGAMRGLAESTKKAEQQVSGMSRFFGELSIKIDKSKMAWTSYANEVRKAADETRKLADEEAKRNRFFGEGGRLSRLGRSAGRVGGSALAAVFAAKEGLGVATDLAGGKLGDLESESKSRVVGLVNSLVKDLRDFDVAVGTNISGLRDFAKAQQDAIRAAEQTRRGLASVQDVFQRTSGRQRLEREGLVERRGLDELSRGLHSGLFDSQDARTFRANNLRRDIDAGQSRIGELQGQTGGGILGQFSRQQFIGEEANRVKALGKELLDIELKNLEVIRQQGKEKVAGQEKALDLIKQQKEQLLSSAERFGLQSPAEQRRILELSRKVAAGGQLATRDIAFAQQNRELFAGPLRDVGVQRAQGAGFSEILRNLKLGDLGGLQKAEVAMKNEIKVQVDRNAGDIAKQIAEQIEPAMRIHDEQIIQRVAAEIRRQQFERQANVAAGLAGGG